MTWIDLAERHPVVATLALFLLLVLLAVYAVILWLANVTISEEQARARPQYFALIGLCKKLGPVLIGTSKWLAGVLIPVVAKALVDEKFSPTTSTIAPPAGTIPPGAGQSLPPVLSLPSIPPVSTLPADLGIPDATPGAHTLRGRA